MSWLSLRARLALTFTATTTVLVVAIAVVVQVLVGRALVAQVDDALDEQSELLLSELTGEDETAEVVEDLAETRLPPNRGVQVVDADGSVVAARGEDTRTSRLGPALIDGVLDGQRVRGTVSADDGERRLVALGASGTVVVVTEDLGEVASTQATLLGVLVPVGVVAALLAGALAWYAAGRGLVPLHRIARGAADIDASRLDTRLPDSGTRDEVGTLAATLNAMLDRLGTAIDRERPFTADASHELRTPLAILRGEVELARPHVAERPGQRLDSALEEADRMRDLIDDLLVLARADADALDDHLEVDLGDLARQTALRFQTLADRDGVRVTATGAAVHVSGDPRGLERAVANLVDNAVRHTPPGGTVNVTTAATVDGAEVVVRDTGPGVPTEALTTLFDRFTRPDDARTSGGAGLGLAIVAAVAEGHGGRATARNADGDDGGLEVTVTLPRTAGRGAG